MRRAFRFHAMLAVLVAAIGTWSIASMAQGSGDAPAADATKPDKKKGGADVLVLPVPFSDPVTGTGIAFGGVVFYNPNSGKHQWTSGGGVVWSSDGSKGIALFHKMSSADDRFRLNANFSYFDNDDRYYGIGADDGDRDESLHLDALQFKIKLRGLWEVTQSVFLGAQYVLLLNDSVPREEAGSVVVPPPEDELDSTMSAIGPVAVYDTRDNHDQPRDGVYLSASWLFGSDALGDSFKHNTFTLQANAYHPLGKDTVLAGRVSFCTAGGDAAYYALCRYGASNNLRGYPADRYRDRAAWAAQSEVRHEFSSRWGGVAFFGVGGISPSGGDIFSGSNFLPAGGAGVRYRLFKGNDVRLRLDFAAGKDASGIYLSIGEAY